MDGTRPCRTPALQDLGVVIQSTLETVSAGERSKNRSRVLPMFCTVHTRLRIVSVYLGSDDAFVELTVPQPLFLVCS